MSVLLGTAVVGVVYWLVKSFAVWFAAAAMAVSIFAIGFAHEMRVYGWTWR